MTKRWKYQIKSGLFWGIFMTIALVLFESQEVSLSEQLVMPEIYIRAAGFILIGIFVLGYINWRSLKRDL